MKKRLLKLFNIRFPRTLLTLALTCGCAVSLLAQGIRITGKVTDESGAPLAGASIVVKGTTNGVGTDAGGNYSITVPDNSAVLEASFVSYTSQEIAVGSRTQINFALAEDQTELGEVVVTAMGIKKDTRKVGYAVSTIDSKDLTKVGVPNFASALYGKAAGVRIQAAPGGNTSAVSMTVRGLSSITGNNQPLLVVDGVPVRNGNANNGEDDNKTSRGWDNDHIQGNGIIDINPEDVESISILKGASATALYGSEAANGVILVTSKRNRGKGVKVDFNATLTGNFVAYMPQVQTEYGPGNERLSMGGYEFLTDGFVERTYNGKTYKSVYNGSTRNFGPKYDGSDVLYWDGSVRKYDPVSDSPWTNLFRTGFNQNYNIAIAHGGEKTNTRFSYTFVDDSPNQINSTYSKHNFNLTGSVKILDNLSIDYTANYIRQNIFNRPLHINWMLTSFNGVAGSFDDMTRLKEKTVTSMGYRNVAFSNDEQNTLTPDEALAFSVPFGDAMNNYVWPILAHKQYETNNRFISSVAPSWDIIEGLTLRGRLSTDLTSENVEKQKATERPLLLYPNEPGGEYETFQRSHEIYYGDIMLMFNRDLSEKIALSANIGFQGRSETVRGTRLRTDGGLSTENWFHIKASRKTPGYWQDRVDLLKTAVFGTVGVSIANALYLEATMRQEKTSTLSKGNNSYFYPSANASWVYTESLKDVLPSWYDYGKLRMSYGIVGNAPEAYAANVAYSQDLSGGYIYNRSPNSYGNEGIKPETKHEYELGLESRFFKNRFGFEVSYYNNRIIDQILNTSIPQSTGATSILLNIGELKNYGVELSVNGTPVQTKDFRWDLRAHYSFNRNEVVKLNDGADFIKHDGIDEGGGQIHLRSVVGRPMGDIYAYVPKKVNGRNVIGSNGIYAMEETERVNVGNVMPDAIGGIGSTLSYKNLALDFLFDFRIGGKVMNWGYQYSMARGTNPESLAGRDEARGGLAYYFENNKNNNIANIHAAASHNAAAGPNGEKILHDGIILDGVKDDGSENTQIVPVSRYYHYMYNWGSGCDYTKSIFDNSYMKLREVSLTYQLPASVYSRLGCRSLSVSVFGRNLFYVFKNMPMFDAEATDGTSWIKQSYINGATATTRTVGFSLRASF
ncbi:MAG: SusC/RagA family TonB-linked outer membrane protein [Prevotellaceae bacterium]|jgi:TonB-linked SusC/RagA family outer membrane protein|nr:SusC/RagA family TonB-linked outer membrane protein [Prevotellaceae bacterium]